MSKSKFDQEILDAYEAGELISIRPSTGALDNLRTSARSTFLKDRRVNIRMSSPDLMDIQARAAEEGVPYQTLISSVLHRFVTGQFIAKPSRLASRSRGHVAKRRQDH